jgi:N-glycosylase/DNA lyase
MWHTLALAESQLCLSSVLKCGQSFRWIAVGSPPEYHLCLPDRVVCLKQNATTLFYRAVLPDPQPSPLQLSLRQAETLVWLNSYFQLDVDLQNLYAEWATRDKVFSSIETRFAGEYMTSFKGCCSHSHTSGIRILRQVSSRRNALHSIYTFTGPMGKPHFVRSALAHSVSPSIISRFICSSNNNIGRITKMVHSLCRHYSAPLLSIPDPSDQSIQVQYYPFPSPSVLAAPDVGLTLRGLGFGYRADFIQRTAKMLVETHGTGDSAEKFLASLRNSSTEDARNELLKFVGVGRKVADCVLLMSLDKVCIVGRACLSAH